MRVACTVLIAICLCLAGCHGDDDDAADACASCYGQQNATQDGKCETCGAPAQKGGGGRH